MSFYILLLLARILVHDPIISLSLILLVPASSFCAEFSLENAGQFVGTKQNQIVRNCVYSRHETLLRRSSMHFIAVEHVRTTDKCAWMRCPYSQCRALAAARHGPNRCEVLENKHGNFGERPR